MKTWIAKLQTNYSTFAEWAGYAETYGLAARLGFDSAAAAWEANPLIGGSVNPADFGLVELDEFTKGYLLAAFWTNDDEAPGGMDYAETDRFDVMFANLHPAALDAAAADCRKFQEQNAALLASAGDGSRNGGDFWLTRCGHGCGFWDRDYAENIGKGLTDAAHAFGNVDLYTGDDGRLYFS